MSVLQRLLLMICVNVILGVVSFSLAAEESKEMGLTASFESQRRSIEDVYKARSMGIDYFDHGQYEEAYPLLMTAALHGLKRAQARLGYMHLYGFGPAEKDARYALGWLGVAADGLTEAKIRKVFRDVWKKVPKANRPAVQKLIDKYIASYGTKVNDVKCMRVNKRGSQIRVVECFIEDPDGRLVTDELDRAGRDLIPGSFQIPQ